MKLLVELLAARPHRAADHPRRRTSPTTPTALIEIKDGRIVADPGSAPHSPTQRRFTPSLAGRDGSNLADMLEAAKMALRSLRANLFRSVLTLLGIVIGVGSVIAMLAIGDGAKQAVIDRISAMGIEPAAGAPRQRPTSAASARRPRW
ncbi:MAG: ABC transporter permease [Burkholderiaceae bacterium]